MRFWVDRTIIKIYNETKARKECAMISELSLAVLCLVIRLGISNISSAAVNVSLIVQEALPAAVSGAIGVRL
jgi:hypothetical protein